MAFNHFLKKEVEEIISEERSILEDGPHAVSVADITLAFNNHDLIRVLEERGGHVTNGEIEKIKECDEKIMTLKEKNASDFKRPVAAFITFNHQEGYERAIRLKEKRFFFKRNPAKRAMLHQPLYLNPAPEPTNIIWENRHYSFLHKIIRAAIAIAVMALLMFLVFVAFYFLKLRVNENNKKYPAVSCSNIE